MKTGTTIQRLEEAKDNLTSAILAVKHERRATATQKIKKAEGLLNEVIVHSTMIAPDNPRTAIGRLRSKTECEEHKRVPAQDYEGNCYGELWQCTYCRQLICAGFGSSDGMLDACDNCWAGAHSMDKQGNTTCHRVAGMKCVICPSCGRCRESLGENDMCTDCNEEYEDDLMCIKCGNYDESLNSEDICEHCCRMEEE